MINLELPRRLRHSSKQAHQVAAEIFRPISRKYDLAEHEYPVELDTMAAMVDGLSDSGTQEIGGATGGRTARPLRRPRSPVSRPATGTPTAATCPRFSTRSRHPGATPA